MTNFSVQLKTLREKNKITQSEMAKILGVKERGAVSLYESGKRKLTLVQYFKLIDHFGESAYEAFEIKNQKPNTSQMLEEEGVMYITQASELKSKYIACLEEKEKLRQRISELEAKK